jgi:MFS family permease
VTVSLRQRIVPGHLLGRVNSVYRMLGWGLMPAGALAGGLVAHAAGLRAPYLVAGLLCTLSVCAALPLLLTAARGIGDHDRQLRTVTIAPITLPNGPWRTRPRRYGRCPRGVQEPVRPMSYYSCRK